MAIALCRVGGFIAVTTPLRPAVGASIDLEILGFGERPVSLEATVAAHTSDGVEIRIREASFELLTLIQELGTG